MRDPSPSRVALPAAAPAGIEVWRLDLDLDAPLAAADWAVLDGSEQAQAARLLRHHDRIRMVAARAALRRLLAERLHREPVGLRFVRTAEGKPELADRAVRFNISHAGACALIALSPHGAVGVDIECCDTALDVADLAWEAMSSAERAAFGRCRRGFFRCWAVKEAAAKAVGSGIDDGFLGLSALSAGSGGCWRMHHPDRDWSGVLAWELAAPAGYVAAVAHANENFSQSW